MIFNYNICKSDRINMTTAYRLAHEDNVCKHITQFSSVFLSGCLGFAVVLHVQASDRLKVFNLFGTVVLH